MSDKLHSASRYKSRRGDFCATIITASGVQFHVNKIMLCKCSVYFRTLITRHSAPDRELFDIPGMSAEVMQLIIEFAHTGSVSVTEDNVQELLVAADQFMITGIEQLCYNFLMERLSPDNCIGIWQFTKFCCCPDLKLKAHFYILGNFEEVVSSEEFLGLSVQELADILARDDLYVRQEKTLYEAVIKWMAHAPTERNRHFPPLLSKVRLALTDTDYIRAVMGSEDVKSNAKCMEVVGHAMLFKDHMTVRDPPLTICTNHVARPRLPNAIIFAIGGCNPLYPASITEVYDFRTDCWTTVANHHVKTLINHGTVFYKRSVYCVGGGYFDSASSGMYRFDLMTGTWHEEASMHWCRNHLTVTELNGYIYAMGGRNEMRARLRTAERYKPETNQWCSIASMQEKRVDASSTALNNRIYVCGGYDQNNRLETCEYYSPANDQWTTIANMSNLRSGHSVIAYADQIFAVGGFDDFLVVNSVEAYNPQTNTWRSVSSMLTNRTNFGIAVIDNKLFVVGGFNNESCISKVEYYDAKDDQWSAASPMGRPRCGLSCCVASELPNMVKYVVSRDSLPQLYMEGETVEAFSSE